MTEKRYYAHKHLLQENQVHDKICHNFMSLDETVEHMNNQYWKYKQLKEENEQLKQRIKKIKKDVDALSCGEEYEQQLKDCTKLAKEEIRKEREDAAIRWANIGR